ncbi:MAG: ABC transporter permease [Chitinophagaceae bacterium]
MFRNYFITTFRNLTRNKVNTFINVAGLAVSIACCIFIYVLVKHERTFDSFHSKSHRTYRIVSDYKSQEGISHNGYTFFPMATAMRTDFPELESVTQVYNGNAIVSITNAAGDRKNFEENEMTFADNWFLKTFDYTTLAGDAAQALSQPDEVVLTKGLADKYFGDHSGSGYNDIIGKVITVNKTDYKVTAVLQDIPRNTNVPFKMLVSFKNFAAKNPNLMQSWKESWSDIYTFVTLPEGGSVARIDAGMKAFTNKYLPAEEAPRYTFHLQPLSQVHTDETYDGTNYATPGILIIAFVTMGLIVLLTACINFINLATAYAVKRAKEIGIRKTLGSGRWQLIVRFMSETLVLVMLAALVALLIASQFIGAFNNYLAFIVDLGLHIDKTVIYFLVALVLFITLLAGYYPARIMSGYQPIQALKNTITAKNTGFANRFSLRKTLVVTQFVITQLLIIGTIVVATQMHYFRSRDLGFSKNDILTVNMPDNDQQKQALLRTQLMSQSGIKSVSFSSGPPTSASNSFSDFRHKSAGPEEKYSIEKKYVDPAYLSTYNIKLVAGRNLQESDKVTLNDSVRNFNAVVNEKTIRTLGYKSASEALGQVFTIDGRNDVTIVGVTDNFFNVPLQQEINPCCMFYGTNWVNMAAIKFNNPQAAGNTMAFIQSSWQKLYPDQFFKSLMLDEYFKVKAFYVMEDIMYQAFKIFAVLSIIIGCMGLYGLVSFLALQREKEIGIRKVLGSSVSGIVYLFSREFAWLVLIAFAVAAPLGYFVMSSWLQTFAHRINVSAVHFILAFSLSIIIAGLTIGFQSVKAAMANPVKSLRSE